jgi:hypothetical protein
VNNPSPGRVAVQVKAGEAVADRCRLYFVEAVRRLESGRAFTFMRERPLTRAPVNVEWPHRGIRREATFCGRQMTVCWHGAVLFRGLWELFLAGVLHPAS